MNHIDNFLQGVLITFIISFVLYIVIVSIRHICLLKKVKKETNLNTEKHVYSYEKIKKAEQICKIIDDYESKLSVLQYWGSQVETIIKRYEDDNDPIKLNDTEAKEYIKGYLENEIERLKKELEQL